MIGTDIDRKVCDVALDKGARPLTLLSKEETHKFLDAKRAAGVKSKYSCAHLLFLLNLISLFFLTVNAPPSWVTDSRTMAKFKEALCRKIPPHMLNSRTETELFLLNIEGEVH